ncbi:MAG: hypothetical protein B6I18_09325 [Bacteroidetes bacterium 4572_112]|nr:MAG: hypothetical protein B6I18_09325 [Bacteroidetes bacterium 4572_112]
MGFSLKRRFLDTNKVRKAIDKAKIISFPGFAGIAIYDVLVLFIESIQKGVIAQRAAAISYNFLMALFPSILLFIALIPIIPMEGFQNELMQFIIDLLPANTDQNIVSIIDEIITKPQKEILSVGFFLLVWFSTNGFKSIITAFNSSIHIQTYRSFFGLQKAALVLLFVFTLATIITISGFVFDEYIIHYLVDNGYLVQGLSFYLLIVADWIIRIIMLFFMVSFIYWYAPNYHKRFRLISLGSTFTTIVFLIVTFLFNLYISNFSKYNLLYGSIATLIIIMVWMYVNSFILLIGFEINTSIVQATQDQLEEKEAIILQQKEKVSELTEKKRTPFKTAYNNFLEKLKKG